jgi:hypothetical protein
MKIILIFTLLFLNACLGPSLFTINGLKITASDVITVPQKIEALTTNKKEKTWTQKTGSQ